MAKTSKVSQVTDVEELTEADRYYIRHNTNLSIGELCKNTGKTRLVVSEYLASVPKNVRAEKSTYMASIDNGLEGDRKLAFHARHKRGAIVSTQAAAEHADENKQKRS